MRPGDAPQLRGFSQVYERAEFLYSSFIRLSCTRIGNDAKPFTRVRHAAQFTVHDRNRNSTRFSNKISRHAS